jgi:hypothetical protein
MTLSRLHETARDLLYLLSLPSSQHASFFPEGVPYATEIAAEAEYFVKEVRQSAIEFGQPYRGLIDDYYELFAIDNLFVAAPADSSFWEAAPREWQWLWDSIASIAARGVTRHAIAGRGSISFASVELLPVSRTPS